jgi:DNA end-binding protein Ku
MAKPKLDVSMAGARSLKTVGIQIGLFNCPTKVYAAISENESSGFSRFCPDCNGAVGNKSVCTDCGREVPITQCRKGYKVTKDQVVTFTEQDMEYMQGEAPDCIKGVGFLDSVDVDCLMYHKPYFLCPENKAVFKHYNLLVESLSKFGKVLLCKSAIRSNERYAVVMPYKNRLLMYQLRFADEMRDIENVPVESAELSKDELGLFKQIIDKMSLADFKVEDLVSEREQRFSELIQKKLNGEQIVIEHAVKQKDNQDLLAQLQATITV